MQQKLYHHLYEDNGLYKWPFSFYNALKVTKNAKVYCNIFDLLSSEILSEELNLHSLDSDLVDQYTRYDVSNSPFVASGLTREKYFLTLPIKNWNYTHFVLSAFFFIVQEKYRINDLAAIKIYCCDITGCFWQFRLSKSLVDFFKTTNLLKMEPKTCIEGFWLFFEKQSWFFKNSSLDNTGYSFKKENLLLFLSMFDVDSSSILQIVKNCEMQNSIKPLVEYLWLCF